MNIYDFSFDHPLVFALGIVALVILFAFGLWQIDLHCNDHAGLVDVSNGMHKVFKKDIDGHEYIVTDRGGIVHSASCPCHDRAAPLQRPLQTVAKLEEESGATR